MVLGVSREFGKYRVQGGDGCPLLPHDQIAELIDDVDQATVLAIDFGQPGDEAGVPVKRFHELLFRPEMWDDSSGIDTWCAGQRPVAGALVGCG